MTAILTPVFRVGAAAAVEAAASVLAAGAAAVSAADVADEVSSSLEPHALTMRAAMAATARILNLLFTGVLLVAGREATAWAAATTCLGTLDG